MVTLEVQQAPLCVAESRECFRCGVSCTSKFAILLSGRCGCWFVLVRNCRPPNGYGVGVGCAGLYTWCYRSIKQRKHDNTRTRMTCNTQQT